MGDEIDDTHSPAVSEELDGMDATLDGVDSNVAVDSSSSADDDGDKKSLLDVVRDAAPGEDEDGDASDTPAETDRTDETSEEEEEETTGEEGRDEQSRFDKHPRFQQLIRQRDEYKTGHEQFKHVESYMRENGLTGDDVAQSMRFAALMKSDPVTAWKEMKPLIQDLVTRAGEVVPEDLRADVAAGRVSRERAVEISRLRAAQSSSEAQRVHEAQVRQTSAQHDASQAMQQAAAEWETAQAANPEFAVMSEELQREVLWRQRQEGMPTDAEGVRTMLDGAFKAVKARHRPAAKPSLSPVRGGRAASGNTSSAPKSILDLIETGGA